ncbi:LOW QUALITY PROTEIN: hypothetical protein Cgig2_028678 [Carnegiea gigantea]|uniref:Uncharacterized protein n=1 Tax=Carnegiea gigantea TaxID=171969 RepID=A0A9Q1QG53_9CARY|nr:LOW QUALITY PROTEIN: hypothetical protein Cgig2_028678 [Carnegiea gigantea]
MIFNLVVIYYVLFPNIVLWSPMMNKWIKKMCIAKAHIPIYKTTLVQLDRWISYQRGKKDKLKCYINIMSSSCDHIKIAGVKHSPSYTPSPVYIPTPMYKSPTYSPIPIYKSPVYKSSPVYSPSPVYKSPIYTPSPVYKTPVYSPSPVYTPSPVYKSPVYTPSPMYKSPIYSPSAIYESPSYNPTPIYRSPVYSPSPAYNSPSYISPSPIYKSPAYTPSPVHKAHIYCPTPIYKSPMYSPSPFVKLHSTGGNKFLNVECWIFGLVKLPHQRKGKEIDNLVGKFQIAVYLVATRLDEIEDQGKWEQPQKKNQTKQRCKEERQSHIIFPLYDPTDRAKLSEATRLGSFSNISRTKFFKFSAEPSRSLFYELKHFQYSPIIRIIQESDIFKEYIMRELTPTRCLLVASYDDFLKVLTLEGLRADKWDTTKKEYLIVYSSTTCNEAAKSLI